MKSTTLPNNWCEVTFEDVLADISNGISDSQNKESDGIPVSRIETIATGKVNLAKIGYVSGISESAAERYLLNPGDILFSHINSPAHIGKTAIFRSGRLYHGTNLLRIRTQRDACTPEYFEYYCRYFRSIGEFSISAQHAVNQSSLNQKKIKAFTLPLPPLAEQNRITQKLDELLAQVDTLKARIDAIPALLKSFRQSVLAAAVSGRLTVDWRSSNQLTPLGVLLDEIASERSALKARKILKASFGSFKEVDALYQLPCESWKWVCFDQISKNDNNALKAGPFGSALKKSDCVQSGYKVYGQEQVISGDEKLATYFIDADKFKDLEACRVGAGDILISLVGTIGKVLVLSDKAEIGIINPRLVKISVHPAVSREYLRLYLDSGIAHGFFKRLSHGGTMEILNLGILKELPIPLPSIAEQTEIVRRVEQLLAFADQLEAKVASAKSRIDHLTQSILAKAFRGELVTQDPNDEPASVLLERIQAQRAAAPKAKRGRKASA